MNRLVFFRTLLALTLLAPFAFGASAAEKSAAKAHPLRGVITRVEAETSSLMVKHEEIPGVMRAMTMRFKVAPDVVKKFKAGDAIIGMMSRGEKEWLLDDVTPDPTAKTK